MAVSAFQKLVNKLFREFALRHGREPMTPKEWMDIQNEAVQFFNRTKGAPTKPKAPPFQGFKPKVIQGGKGIESLLKSGDVKKGVAPKTKKKIDLSKYTDDDLNALVNEHRILSAEAKKLGDAGEHYEKFSQLNNRTKEIEEILDAAQAVPESGYGNIKADLALQKQKKSIKKKTVEDFRDEGDWDPSGFAAGGIAKGAKWFINSLKKNLNDMEAGHPRFKVIPAKDQETLKVGYRTFIKELEAGNEVPVEALEAISKNPQYYKTKKVVRSQDPDLAEVEELIDEKVFGDVRQELKDFEVVGRKPQASGGLAYMLGEPNTRTEALQEFGVVTDPWGMYTDPSLYAQGERSTGTPGRTDYAGGGNVGHGPWTIGRTPPGPQSQPEMPQPQVQGTPNPMHMPKGIPSAVPRSMDPQYQQQQMMQQMMAQQMGQQPRMGLKHGGGLKVWGKDVDEQWSNLNEDQKNWIRENFPDAIHGKSEGGRIEMGAGGITKLLKGFLKKKKPEPKEFIWGVGGKKIDLAPLKKKHGLDPESLKKKEEAFKLRLEEILAKHSTKHAEGGRIGFAGGGMGRRAFLKLMAGLASLPFIGKGVQKAAPKVLKEATKITRDVDGIPTYAFDLIEVVKAKGTKEIMEGIYKRNPPSTKYNYKGVEVTEDGLGNTSVRKEQTKTGHWTDEATDDTLVDDYVDREIGFEIRKGVDEVKDEGLETQKVIQGADEYDESTAYMQGDPDGGIDVSDIVEKIDDADHLDLKKIADEIKDIRPKKASGGLAHMLGE